MIENDNLGCLGQIFHHPRTRWGTPARSFSRQLRRVFFQQFSQYRIVAQVLRFGPCGPVDRTVVESESAVCLCRYGPAHQPQRVRHKLVRVWSEGTR